MSSRGRPLVRAVRAILVLLEVARALRLVSVPVTVAMVHEVNIVVRPPGTLRSPLLHAEALLLIFLELVRMLQRPLALVHLVPLLRLQLARPGRHAMVYDPARQHADRQSQRDAAPIGDLAAEVETLLAARGQHGQARAHEDVDQQLDRGERGRGGELPGADGAKGGEGGVGQRVGQGAEADHGEDAEAVALEHAGEGGEAGVGGGQARGRRGQQVAEEQERGERAGDVGRGDERPAGGEAVQEARQRDARRVADHGREGGGDGEAPQDGPAAAQRAPLLGDGQQPGDDALAEDEQQDAEDGAERDGRGHEGLLERVELLEGAQGLPADALGGLEEALRERRVGVGDAARARALEGGAGEAPGRRRRGARRGDREGLGAAGGVEVGHDGRREGEREDRLVSRPQLDIYSTGVELGRWAMVREKLCCAKRRAETMLLAESDATQDVRTIRPCRECLALRLSTPCILHLC